MAEFLDYLYLEMAYRHAEKSTCSKAKVGAIIVAPDGEVVGVGWNHSPNPRCEDCATLCAGGIRKGIASGTRVELCYAVHAEQYAIFQAGARAKGGILIVARLDSNGERFLKDPKQAPGSIRRGFYCTLCARFAYMAQIKEVLLDSVDGPYVQSLDSIWESSYEMVTHA